MPFDSKPLKEAGFNIWHTGGNCKAWGQRLAPSYQILITDSDGTGLWEQPTAKRWMIGLYNKDGDELTFQKGVTLAEALAIATQWEYEPLPIKHRPPNSRSPRRYTSRIRK